MLGMGEKTLKRKNSPFGCPPIPLLRYAGWLLSGVRERWKQAGPTLSGRETWSNGKKKKQSRIWWGQVGWIYSDEVPRSSEEVCWSKGGGIKIEMGKILEANN